jgi:hypothetical protein
MSQNELAQAYTRLISLPLKDRMKGAASYAFSLTKAFQEEKGPSVESLEFYQQHLQKVLPLLILTSRANVVSRLLSKITATLVEKKYGGEPAILQKQNAKPAISHGMYIADPVLYPSNHAYDEKTDLHHCNNGIGLVLYPGHDGPCDAQLRLVSGHYPIPSLKEFKCIYRSIAEEVTLRCESGKIVLGSVLEHTVHAELLLEPGLYQLKAYLFEVPRSERTIYYYILVKSSDQNRTSPYTQFIQSIELEDVLSS